jgi:hypothetical protein
MNQLLAGEQEEKGSVLSAKKIALNTENYLRILLVQLHLENTFYAEIGKVMTLSI